MCYQLKYISKFDEKVESCRAVEDTRRKHPVMEGCKLGVAIQASKSSSLSVLAFDSLLAGKDWSKLNNLEYDGKRLKWTGQKKNKQIKQVQECKTLGIIVVSISLGKVN